MPISTLDCPGYKKSSTELMYIKLSGYCLLLKVQRRAGLQNQTTTRDNRDVNTYYPYSIRGLPAQGPLLGW